MKNKKAKKFTLSLGAKVAIFLVALVAVIFAVVAALVLPKTTEISQTFTVNKYSLLTGTLQDTMELTVTGTRQDYLFTDSIADWHLEAFEDFYQIKTTTLSDVEGLIKESASGKYEYVRLLAYGETVYSTYFTLAFSPDYDYWMMFCDYDNSYYIGSVSGTATEEELLAFFAGSPFSFLS